MGRITLQRFLADISGLHAVILDDVNYKKLFDRARHAFFPTVVAKIPSVDLTDASDDDVRTLLEVWGLPAAEVCYVFWLSEAAGIRISGREFVSRYDDLWLPGKDDLWVVASDFTKLVWLTHEEEASLYEPQSSQSSY